MHYYILTLFPEMVSQGLNASIIGKAIEQNHISVESVDIRDYTEDKHKKVDDYPYGGGAGMLMQAQPVYAAYQAVRNKMEKSPRVIYMTPQGTAFNQNMAKEFAKEENLVFLCGHYEGIDERVLEEIVTDYVSIGDYVLTGGELPAMVMIDAISRLVPMVLQNEESAQTETFHKNLLEYAQYTRPEVWKGKRVPDILLSGNHRLIAQFRLEESIQRTKERRPDLYQKYRQTQYAIEFLQKNRLNHMNMIEILRRGLGELTAVSTDGVLLRENFSGIYMMSVNSMEAGLKFLEKAEGAEQAEWFVVHQEYMIDIVKEHFGLRHVNPCIQAVYTRKEPLASARKLIGRKIDIRCLGVEYEQEIIQHYHTVETPGYIKNRLIQKKMFGAFVDGKLAGFIGSHSEGSLGMLEVFEEYRNQGIATALEAHGINRILEEGNVPFVQIMEENEASVKLQRKLGLAFAKEKVYWIVA